MVDQNIRFALMLFNNINIAMMRITVKKMVIMIIILTHNDHNQIIKSICINTIICATAIINNSVRNTLSYNNTIQFFQAVT